MITILLVCMISEGNANATDVYFSMCDERDDDEKGEMFFDDAHHRLEFFGDRVLLHVLQ